jgi:diguanylate cyclase (GGDEF)-like protein
LAKQTVLVAHFDAGERERLARLLRGADVEVVEAADGEEAAKRASEQRLALALVSCMLPKLSGFELCRQLSGPASAERPHPPVPTVLVSDVDDPYVRARARHVGAKRVLFGSVGADQTKDLLATSWENVDPLDLSSRERGGAGDRLFRELLAGDAHGDDGSLLSRVTDPLTGLVNSEYLALKVQEECKRCARYGQPLALLIAEIESFDQLAEKQGKAAADEALLEIAGVFLCESRDIDVAGRVGSSRFHLLLPNTTLEGVRALAGRIAANLVGRTLTIGEREVPLTIHMGVTALPGNSKVGADEFVRRAEQDLASAQVAEDGRGANLRDPVEPLATPQQSPARE